MKKVFIFILGMVLALCAFGAQAQEKVRVAVSILPQLFFVEAIGQERVLVSVMIPPGGNPHTYEPTPGQLKALSTADLYIKVGSGLEFERQWLNKFMALNPRMRLVNSSAGIQLLSMSEHSHHGECDHHHPGGADPHVWLSPRNAIVMIANIRDSLSEIDAAHEAFYRKNAGRLILELSELQEELFGRLAGLKNRVFIVFHPAWGYFASDFDLQQVAVEYSGKDPTPRQLARLIRQAKKINAKVIFASPQFSQKSARTIADEIRGEVVLIDPLAADYLANLRAAADALAGSLE